MRSVLRSALVRAMRDRDQQAMAAYRIALAAIDNAEAVPLAGDRRAGAIELSDVGVGASEVPRRLLTESDMRQIVDAEAADLREMATSVDRREPTRADRFRRQAALLDDLVRPRPSPTSPPHITGAGEPPGSSR